MSRSRFCDLEMLFKALVCSRRCIGVDIDSACVERVREKLPAGLGCGAVVLQGDSTSKDLGTEVKGLLREEMGQAYGQFVLLHPPYYRDYVARGDRHELAGDLGLAKSVNAYCRLFHYAARRAFELLEPGRFAALVIGDSYYRDDLVPISAVCVLRMLRVGFHVKCWNVKNWQKYNGTELRMWEGRALAGGFNVFEHEHVVVFRKPTRGGKVCYCYR